MSAQILDGKSLAQTIRQELKSEVESFIKENSIQPGLAVILVGDNPASQVYVRNKVKGCLEAGMNSIEHRLPAETSQEEVVRLIDDLNSDPKVHGILVQLPLPPHFESLFLQERTHPLKDVDGLHPLNVGNLWIGKDCLVSCTPLGVMEILKRADIPLKGKQAVIVGRSNIVGKPMACLLMQQHATITVCHSRTHDLPGVCRTADILVAATGMAKMIKGDWIKPGAVVIDVGISFEEVDGKFKQVGDVDRDAALEVAGYLSPSPGGPGPMTIAMLLCNTLKAAKMQIAGLR